MKNKNTNVLITFMMLAFFFYGYARSFLHLKIINSIARGGIYFTLFLCLYFALRRKKIRVTKLDWMLFATCIVPIASLIGKNLLQGQKSETIAWSVMYITGTVLIIVCRNYTSAGYSGIKVLTVYSVFFVFCTYFLMATPELFKNVVVKLFSQATQATVLKTYNAGYMCGFTSHYSTNGIYISIACCLALSTIIAKLYENKMKFKYWIIFLICLGALGLTGKRGPFAMIIFACMVTLYMYYADRPQRRIVKFAVYAFGSLILLSIVATVFPAALNSITRTLEYFQADSGKDFMAGCMKLWPSWR